MGSSESTLVKLPHCLKSHVPTHMFFVCNMSFGILTIGIIYKLFTLNLHMLLYVLSFCFRLCCREDRGTCLQLHTLSS